MNRAYIIKKNLSFGLVAKIIGMGLSYLSLPIILNYLGERNYGVWITIFSILSWIFNFDVGIGNGLKNKLTEALIQKEIKLAKEYITTSYIIIIIITSFLLFIGTLGISYLKLTEILNVKFLDESYLKVVVFISFIFTLCNFVLGLYKQLYYAIHESAIVGITDVIYYALVIILILLFKNYYESSLLMLALAYGLSNLIVGLIFSKIFFEKRKELLPNFRFFNKNCVKDVMGIGIEFFIIQLSMIIIFTTDNLIITKLIGPKAVTSYNVVLKVFQIFIIISSIITTPFWTLYTDAYIKKDTQWICKTLKRFNLLFIVLVIVIIFLIFNIDFLLKIWLQKELVYPRYLVFLCGIFTLIRVYGDIYMKFLNGIGKIRIQVYLYMFGALVNIPLSIYFVKRLNLGSSGVILATNICMISFVVLMPLQSYIEIKKIRHKLIVKKV